MSKKLKVTLIFLLGWLCGALSITLIAVYGIYRSGGSTLMEPKLYGNIKIYPWRSEDEIVRDIGLANWIYIEKDNEVLLTLSFDENNEFSGFSFWNKGNDILDYAVPQDVNFASVIYGTFEQNLSWMDYNSDGILDIQHNKSDNIKKILIDDEWAEVEFLPDGVKVIKDEEEKKYSFDYKEGKWLPVKTND